MRIIRLTCSLIVAALFSFVAPSVGATTNMSASCYDADIASPTVRHQTVLVIDLTTSMDVTVARDFRDAAIAASREAGQRLVVLTFAGLTSGEMLSRELDITLEAPVVDEEVINNARIGPFRRSQECVAARLKIAPELMRKTLDRLLMSASQPLARSEIVYSVRQAIGDFATQRVVTRFLVYSDGLENSSGGMSFYKGGASRKIDASVEGVRLRRTGLAVPVAGAGGPFRVLWWGLLAHEVKAGEPATARYLSADAIGQLSLFWSTTLTGWGTRAVTIGPTLNNPSLDFPAMPAPAKR